MTSRRRSSAARREAPADRSRARKAPAHDYQDSARGVRLQKVLAEAGVASRRASETLIEEGAVSINGEFITELPIWVDPRKDRIVVNGQLVRVEDPVYVMLFKPRGVVCTNSDPEGRSRAIDLVQHPSHARLFPVGRLDMDSSGLLLLTNDGELANRLSHPRYEMHKTYHVTVRGRVEDETLRKLEQGVFLYDRHSGKGRRTSESGVTLIKRDRDRTHLRIELREGRNRQIRRVLLRVGHPVKKLRRVQLGPLKLKGLAIGAWRELTGPELAALKRDAYGDIEKRRKRQAAAAAQLKRSIKKSTRRSDDSQRKGRATSSSADRSASRKTDRSPDRKTNPGSDRRASPRPSRPSGRGRS